MARLGLWASLLVCLVTLAGCMSKPAPKKFTFFPPPPDEPRVQYLGAFSSDRDLGWTSTFAEFITGKPSAQNPLIKPYGIAMWEGKIFVCDTMVSAVEVFDLGKKRVGYFTPDGEGRLKMPVNITIDVDGTRYIADTGRGQVLIFNKDTFVAALGGKDDLRPSDVALTTNRVYVTDVKGHVVRVYDKATRKPLFTIPRDPQNAEKKLLSPTNLSVDQQRGRLAVTDTGAFSVSLYDLEGNYIRTVGDQGVAPGLFARPKGVALDRAGLAYVVDASTQLVQIFDEEGKLLMFFGQPESSPQGDLHLPAAVSLDYENVRFFEHAVAPGYRCEYLILVTSQVGDKKVTVFGFVKKK